MDREAWWATHSWGCKESDMTEQLTLFDCFPLFVHFLTSLIKLIKLILWLRFFHRQKAGREHRVLWNTEGYAPSKNHSSNCLQTTKILSEAGVADYLNLQSTLSLSQLKISCSLLYDLIINSVKSTHWLKKKLSLYHWTLNLVTFHRLFFPIDLSLGLIFNLLFVWPGNLLHL